MRTIRVVLSAFCFGGGANWLAVGMFSLAAKRRAESVSWTFIGTCARACGSYGSRRGCSTFGGFSVEQRVGGTELSSVGGRWWVLLKATYGESIGNCGDSKGVIMSSGTCKDGESIGKCEGLRRCIGGDVSAERDEYSEANSVEGAIGKGVEVGKSAWARGRAALRVRPPQARRAHAEVVVSRQSGRVAKMERTMVSGRATSLWRGLTPVRGQFAPETRRLVWTQEQARHEHEAEWLHRRREAFVTRFRERARANTGRNRL